MHQQVPSGLQELIAVQADVHSLGRIVCSWAFTSDRKLSAVEPTSTTSKESVRSWPAESENFRLNTNHQIVHWVTLQAKYWVADQVFIRVHNPHPHEHPHTPKMLQGAT